MVAPRPRRRPSSIDRLDPEIKDLIGKLRIDFGWTLDEIIKKLRDLGQGDISRSALARHTKSLEEIGAQLRHSREVAQALVAQVGDAPEDRVADLNVELLHSVILRLVTATNDDSDGKPVMFEPEDVRFLSQSLQSLASARKTNTDTVFRVRKEATEAAAKKAGDAAAGAARAQGVTKDGIAAIREAITVSVLGG